MTTALSPFLEAEGKHVRSCFLANASRVGEQTAAVDHQDPQGAVGLAGSLFG